MNLPTIDEEAPRATKIIEKPAMKAREFVIVRNWILFLSAPSLRSSKETPVIKET
jgi:hypothetical protein